MIGVAAFAVLSQFDDVELDLSESLMFGLASLLFTALGGLITVRVPGNRLGWVISGVGLTSISSAVARQLTDMGVIAAFGFGSAMWMSTFALLGFLTLWFPTGQPPTRRWLPFEWLGYLMLGVVLFLSFFSERFCTGADRGTCSNYVDNPIGINGVPDLEYGASGMIIGTFLLFVIGGFVSLLVRFVRSRGIERLQLKWFTYSVAMLVSWIILESIAEMAGLSYSGSWVAAVVFGLLFLGVPVSAVTAVLRYRLYDIDRVISRTLSYALVLALLALVYLGTVTVLAQTLPVESDMAVAGATLAVAAGFAPLRRRVQKVVDRRFNRTRYTANQEMAAFADEVRDTTDISAIEREVRSVIDRTMQPVATAMWLSRRSDRD